MAVVNLLSVCLIFIEGLYNVILRIFNIITLKQSLAHVLWELILYRTRNAKPRVRDYDISDTGDLEDNGIRVPATQRDLEHRRPIKHDESDTILIYGCQAQKQRLLVRVSVSGQVSLATLFLRLENGKSYTLPKIRVTNVPRTTSDCFVGNGLRIRCVVPMRKWRVSYAGPLEETSENGEKKLVNVKLGLCWTCSAKVHDLQSDIPNSDLAEIFASHGGLLSLKTNVNFNQDLDCYLQAGNMIGSLFVDGQEKVLALWGARKRSVEREVDISTEVIVYTKDGQMFHFGSMQISPYPKKLKYGFVTLRSTICCQLTKVFMVNNQDDRIKEALLSTGEYDFCIKFGKKLDEVEWPVADLQKTKCKVNVTFTSVVLEEDTGEALVLQNNRNASGTSSLSAPSASLMALSPSYQLNRPGNEVVSLAEAPCHYPGVTGGKGSSLASLFSLKKQIEPTYNVPDAIVVSTLAYEIFSNSNQIQSLVKSLENVAWNHESTNEKIEDTCEKISSTIGQFVLPQSIQAQIENKLAKVCGENYLGKRFAVRSSASGEDSEEMSAAGQMKTFLGLIGLKNISEAVVQCWASQFSFTAVQYKKQNGQELNTPMAVVIQEMVAADTAGVLFTRDPVTGNADRVTISCNYGIGESVVSASADPDTVIFQRDTEDNLELKSVFVGGKNSMTIMSDDNGVLDSSVDEELKKKCCVSVKNAQILAEISVKIEDAYGCPVDLEWAIKNDQIYILQARPITTLDKESELELMHETDSALRSEEEYLTTANTGEVMSKPASPFCITATLPMAKKMFKKYYRSISRWVFFCEEFGPATISSIANHIFINMPVMVLRFHQNGVRNLATEASMISGFGKILDDQDMLDQADRRNKYYPKFSRLKMIIFSIKNLILCKRNLANCRKSIAHSSPYDFAECKNSYEMYVQSLEQYYEFKEPQIRHIDASLLSGLVNTSVMSVLVSSAGGKWSNTIYNDFASILSSCAEVVESATVPAAIEELSRAIARDIDVNKFKTMTKEAALTWLKSTKSETGVKYKQFIKTHGHRGMNEFDVHSASWEMDEMPLIDTLQTMVGSNLQVKTKRQMSTTDTIKSLAIPLSFKSKLLLRLLIPISRRQVACREISKSTYIYVINRLRRACWKIAEKMVSEGRLPDKELFFFLTHFEVFELLETRNPKLIQKAFRRRALRPKLEEIRFGTITKGYPKPIIHNEEVDEPVEASFTLSGTTVSQGYIKAKARVAVNLQEARLIQKGEILVAKGTDIGWSPYFPMVSGVITELGGLVSHGAVVAREYGLPCVVGLEGATRKIKSGLAHVLWELILHRTRNAIPRVRDYPITKNGDLEDNGVRVPAAQRDLEHRRPIKHNESDTILIYGCQAQKQRLLVRVSVSGQVSLATLFLRLENGKSYTLPKIRVTNVPRTTSDSFVANGLRIRCVVPMRKWRVSYAGPLEETSEIGEKKLVNVKLGLCWTCSAKVHDLQSDIPNSDLAEIFASHGGLLSLKTNVNFNQNLDCYVQAGNMIGSLFVDGQEEVLALWGARKRSVEREVDISTEVIVYTKDGQMFHFGSMQISPYPKKLKYGFVTLRSTICCQLTKVFMVNNQDDRIKEALLSTGEYDFCIKFGKKLDEVEWPVADLQKTKCKVNVTFTSVVLEEDTGEALVLQNNRNAPVTSSLSAPSASLMALSPSYQLNRPGNEVVSLAEAPCHYPGVTGGKGSSLASLFSLKKQIEPTYNVPDAIVVSTLAYEIFSNANQIQSLVKSLENVAWNPESTNEKIEDICEKISSTIGQFVLPQSIQAQIENKLAKVCGENYLGKRFAVRSSASGEDSEEMSAAGQMKTFLGLIGLKNISEAVVQCWASQFSFTAVQYKKQNGQELNTPMAVVIQEMVAADTAGVLFTRDPVTGNADRVTISCNYGIGESVVSASADPDTVIFQRDTEDNLELKSVFVGGKNSMTIMSDDNGVLDSSVDEELKKKCCVSVKNAQILAEISVKIEEAYGCPVDLEWAIKNDQIYILQARPITTLDKESELELMHETDSALRSEEEYLTTANTGEVMSKPASPFCITATLPMGKKMYKKYYRSISRWVFFCEEFGPSLISSIANRIFINMPVMVLRFHRNGVRSLATEAFMISGFGKILDDQEMLDQADRRNKYYPKFSRLKMIIFSIKNLILCKRNLTNCRKSIAQSNTYDLAECKNSYEMYVQSLEQYYEFKEPLIRHIDASLLSGLVNTFVMSVLVSSAGGKWSNTIYNDFASILSSCAEVVESATIPAAIEELSRAIARDIDVTKFKTMTKEAALTWLKSTKSETGVKYKQFIKTHGHRGMNEFDVYSAPWEMNEMPLIDTLQTMVGSNLQAKTKRQMSTTDTIKSLAIPLSFKSKLLLRLLIPISRRQVACREISKSTYMYVVNRLRRACWKIAEKMVSEGRLPDKELFFFLTHFEVFELLETRNPKLIQKAFRRRALRPKLEEIRFGTITKGYPKPIIRNEEVDEPVEASFTLSGTTVSQGYIKAKARVAVNLQEARLIQKGEILVAKATDISWSPYFPMVSGVITELGGIVSHGAVVAREYGLPCVVGLEGATRKIKSGDTIILDANKGTVTKINV